MSRPGRKLSAIARKYDVGAYSALLAVSGTAGFFVPAAVARLGVAMTGLAVLWGVRGSSGSFASAGAATAAFSVTQAVIGPQVARLIDRYGQRRVLSRTLPVFGLAVGALVMACELHQPVWLLVLLAGVTGAVVPQVGAVAASRWRHVVGGTDQMATALSLEAALNDITFLVGPVLVTTLSATIAWSAGLVLAVVLVLVGLAVMLSRTQTEPPARPLRVGDGSGSGHGVMTKGFASLFVVNLAMGLFFGSISLCITAFALANHAGASAGFISAASSVVSLTAGLLYGARIEQVSPVKVMGLASVVLTLGCLGLSLVPNVAVMFVGYAFVGGGVALILIPASVLLQRTTRRAAYTQSMVWMNSASVAGIAVAAPVVGSVIEHHGWKAGFLTTAALVSALPLTIAVCRQTLNSSTTTSDQT